MARRKRMRRWMIGLALAATLALGIVWGDNAAQRAGIVWGDHQRAQAGFSWGN